MYRNPCYQGLPVTIARLAGRFIEFTQGFMQTWYDGLVPPLLGHDRLPRMITADYGAHNYYATEAHIRSGLYSWERQILQEYLVEKMRIMVLAAGSGRESLALVERGMQVDAWECSAALREAGNRFFQRESIGLCIQPVEPSKAPEVPSGKTYDFCIVGWSAYCHILRRHDRVALLSDLRQVVTGGVLISFLEKSSPGRLKRMLRRIASLVPGAAKDVPMELVAEPGTIAVGFDEDMIHQEAGAAGFRVQLYRSHSPEYPCAVLVPDGGQISC